MAEPAQHADPVRRLTPEEKAARIVKATVPPEERAALEQHGGLAGGDPQELSRRQRLTAADSGVHPGQPDQEAAMSQTRQPAGQRPPTTKPVAPAIHDTQLVDEMDALLDEIDSVLEENVIETVRSYIQRGGQ